MSAVAYNGYAVAAIVRANSLRMRICLLGQRSSTTQSDVCRYMPFRKESHSSAIANTIYLYSFR
jgi:hypothetical protein